MSNSGSGSGARSCDSLDVTGPSRNIHWQRDETLLEGMGNSPRKRKIGRDYRLMRKYILSCWRSGRACGGEKAMVLSPNDFDENGELIYERS